MIEFAYYVISVCHERTKELRRKLIDYETTGEQRETMRGSEGRKSELPTRVKARCEGDRELADESTACEGGRGRWKGDGRREKIRDATAKSDRAVKITISPLWCAPRALKWEGPVSVGGIHHRGPRDSSIYFSRDAPRKSIFYVDHAERAARPRRRWLFSPWRTKTSWIGEWAEERERRNKGKRDGKNLREERRAERETVV